MGLLSGLIGGFAQGGLDVANDTIKANQRRADQDYESELMMKRQTALEQLREKFEQAKMQAKRGQDMTDAKTIQGDSEAKWVERAQGIINQDTGLNYSPDEVKKIIADPTWVENYGARRDTADGKPTEWTEGGLINPTVKVTPSTDRTRAQELNGKADAAMGIGRPDLAKEFRADANLERQVTATENQTKAAARLADIKEAQTENQRVAAAARDDTRNRQVDAMFAKIGAKGDGTDKAPAEVKAVQWYLENKDNPAAMEAWDKVHQTKSKNVVSIASDLITRDPNAGGKNALTVDKAWEMASLLYDRSTSKNTGVSTPGTPAPAIPASRAAQFKVIR